MINIGNKIKTLREKSNLTKTKLANLADISQSSMSEIELNKYVPSVDIIQKICNALNISLSEFFIENTLPTPIPDNLKILLENARSLTDEQIEILNNFLLTLKK